MIENKQHNSGGFNIVLGNPPWERYKIQDKEWFTYRVPKIANAKNSAARKKLIKEFSTESPELYADYIADRRTAEATSALIRQSGAYPLCGRGDVNTYSVFAELNRYIATPEGRVGCIVPTGIATDDTTRFFFQELMSNAEIAHLFSFWEIRRFFPGTDSRIPFCLLTLAKGRDREAASEFAFDLHSLTELTDEARRFELRKDDIWLFNPISGTCPVFTLRQDFSLSRLFHQRSIPVETSQWSGFYIRLIDMGDHSEHLLGIEDFPDAQMDETFRIHQNGEWFVKLYEAKLINLFDHRFATFEGVAQSALQDGNPRVFTNSELERSNAFVKPRYWVDKDIFDDIYSKYESQNGWLLAYRDITNAASERTCVATAIPAGPATRSLPVLGMSGSSPRYLALANLGSFCFDYAVRQKIGGNHLTFGIIKQTPILAPATYQSHNWNCFVHHRVLELMYMAWDLEEFALDCGYSGPPFRWDQERRFLLRCELDAAYFHLYLGSPSEWETDSPQLREMFATPREAVDYIMETFPIVKRKDIKRTEIKNESGEVTTEGTYITKDTILEIYDEMQQAIDSGEPYQTRLDPPSGPPTDDDGNFIPMSEWDPKSWPSHIHPPKESGNE